jgi:hypothetical protein
MSRPEGIVITPPSTRHPKPTRQQQEKEAIRHKKRRDLEDRLAERAEEKEWEI